MKAHTYSRISRWENLPDWRFLTATNKSKKRDEITNHIITQITKSHKYM